MRIAQLTSPQAPVSPWADGHVERRAGLLADGLVDAGDEVTLLAAEGSNTRAHLVSSPRDDQPDLYALVEHLMGADPLIRGADVVHDHTDIRALLTAVNGDPWIVHTLRNSSNGDEPMPVDVGRITLVAPTHHQASRHSAIDFAAVIHDGIRIDDHPLVRHREGHLAYVGPARPEGGPLIAIAVAELLGCELVLALDVRGDDERGYWRETLAPRVRDASVRVRLMSFGDRSERHAVLGRARALLMPAPLDGDHGLLTVETGALGTPVVVFDRDGVEEFVADGVTGFVVPAGDAPAMADAVDRADTIDPATCRSWVAGRFSHERMVGEYRALYERLLDRQYPRDATTGDSRS